MSSNLVLLTEESAIEDYIKEQQKREQQLKQLLETNKHLQDELKRRDAIENEAKQAQQRAELDKQKQDYIAQAWVDQRKLNRKDIWYFLKVALLNLFLATLSIILTLSSNVKSWLNQNGLFQTTLILVFIAVLLIEILGRSYLFNKERLKRGWMLLSSIWSGKKRARLKSDFETEATKEFERIEGPGATV